MAPPLPGYFYRRAAFLAKDDVVSSSSTPPLAPLLPPAISFTDTIADVRPYIPITLDLNSHNYYHWHHLFDIHLGRCNLCSHVGVGSVPQPHNPQWVKDDLAIIQ